ncbi:C2 domain-containing protein 5 isoform X2 [Zophobas morio]|uniref:C2 domain-containing protein 5 isoform X2 n=1 Tax=Zophobas morio TaxID=2755281 RepID=UPI003083439D
MPGKVKVKIISGRNLPVMDRSSDTTDAYVEIKLGSTTYKTDVCRKSLHPHWNSEWYRFEVDDSELQDEPLQIRLMDHDTYSANDAIGKVYLDLNPLLLPAAGLLVRYGRNGDGNHEHSSNSVMSGWIPVYDTMHGIRGEVNVVVKVELFSDFNRFRQSSCGIQFFCSKSIPHGYFAQTIHGFVEELIVNDDPEYQWIDKIRTPRASNEARQTLFFKLSGELQRKIGVKALDLGGNAVIGYCQCFDLEGESGIVARGIGTAVTLVKLLDTPHVLPEALNEERAQSYLKFLGSQASFHLNPAPVSEPIFPFTKKRFPSPLYAPLPALDIDNPRYKHVPKHLYMTESSHQLRSTRSNPTLCEQIHHPSVKTLLKQEDMRGTPGYGFGQKFKNFKYSSQSMLSKKMTALKAKLGDSGIGEEIDQEASLSEERKKPNRKYKRTISDSSVMAEVLARSVIQAHNSLTCILEAQDSVSSQYDDEPPPGSVTPNTEEELESRPTLLEKTVSEPLLSVQDTLLESHSSVVSSSSSDSGSSDDDEYASDSKDINYETVSNIVKNVELLEKTNSSNSLKGYSKQLSLPAISLDKSFENTETNPFMFPIPPNGEDTQNEDVSDCSPPATEDFPNYYLERLNAPIAKIETDEESDGRDSLNEHNIEMEVDISPSAEPKRKTIIPPIKIGGDFKSKGLFKTAMQTILLEKVGIMGTYTPPMSPSSATTKSSIGSPTSSLSSIQSPNYDKLPRSSTAISLDNMGRRHETVLGAPFTSMCSIRRQSNPCIYSISDSALNKSQPLTASGKDSINRNKISFINLLTRGQSYSGESKASPTEQPEKRKFQFLRLARYKSHDPQSSLKKAKSDDLLKKTFSFLSRPKREERDPLKKHGLVGTALGNVVMETVQDILATTKSEKGEVTQQETPSPVFPSSSILTCTNNDNIPDVSDTASVPINTEIDRGTSVSDNNMHASLPPSLRNNSSPVPEHVPEQGHHRAESIGTKMIQSPAKLNSVPCIYRRSSDSDLSITPKAKSQYVGFSVGNSLTGSDRSAAGGINGHIKSNLLRATVPQENFDMFEYPFLTMSKYPSGFITQIGGAVSARSVKLLERISNLEEPESRDTWWSEIRMEIRSHARALNCNAVLGYAETTSICEDVCVLSASGTAAVIGFQHANEVGDGIGSLPTIPKHSKDILSSSLEQERTQKSQETKVKTLPESPDHETVPHSTSSCSICHLPYNTNNVPIRATVLKCSSCRSGKVPDVLITTIETPDGAPTVGRGCFIQSFVCRPLKDLRGESNAKEISDGLPFLEYELHRLLINKLKIKGMNAIFGLKIRISIGEKMLVGIASGTAVFLTPLPTPVLPKLVSDRSSDEKKLADLQKVLNETVRKNREIYQLKNDDCQNGRVLSDDDSEEEQTSIDLSMGNKDCCVLEVDDPEDADVVEMLMEERPPEGFHVVNTEFVPGLEELEIVKNLQMFTQIYRAKFQPPYNFDGNFRRLLRSVYFKLRRMVPCALCDLQFRVDLPETDEIQLCVLGMALGLGDPQKMKFKRKNTVTKRYDDDLIFNLEEDQIPENSVTQTTHLNTHSVRSRQKSPSRNRIQTVKQRHMPHRERHGVDITPLSYVPGGKIEHYLGNLNFFFIRETTSIREEGGLSGFIHSFVTEVLAIVRAHVTALGGNAMVAYFMTECVLNHSLHKNQGQCLINVGGDVVFVSYFKEDP